VKIFLSPVRSIRVNLGPITQVIWGHMVKTIPSIRMAQVITLSSVKTAAASRGTPIRLVTTAGAVTPFHLEEVLLLSGPPLGGKYL